MTNSADNSTAATVWLREVRHGLASLPGSVRDDILAELDSHIAERVEAGAALRRRQRGGAPTQKPC